MVQIINDVQLDFDDVLIVPQTTSINHREEVEVVRRFKQLEKDLGMGYINEFKCCPIMNANMTQTGTFKIANELIKNNMIGCIHKFYTSEEINRFFKESNCDGVTFFITIGLRNQAEEIQKLRDCKDYMWSILIDVPNAYIPDVEELVKFVRLEFPNRIIAVGNVCTGDATQRLIRAGANIVKVGIGPSKICNTRDNVGVGRPQLSAILDCSNAAHQVGGLIIADGGFKTSGDICKALVAGADICMSGAMFVGCDESSGDIIEKCYKTNEYSFYSQPTDESNTPEYFPDKPKYEIKKYKEYYGMSSFRAQMENYGQKTTSGTSEGVESKLVEYTGKILDTINHIKGALRSCGSYLGAHSVKDFSRQGSFYKVNRLK